MGELEFLAQIGFLGFHLAGRKDQQRQAEQGGNSAGGQQVAFRVQRATRIEWLHDEMKKFLPNDRGKYKQKKARATLTQAGVTCGSCEVRRKILF